MVSNIKAFAKFIDQPMLISKFNRGMPRTLLASGAMFWGVDTYDTMTKSDNKIRATKDSIKKAIVIASTVASAIVAPKIASKVAKRPLMPSVSEIRASNRVLIDTFLKSGEDVSPEIKAVLKNARRQPISFENVKMLMENLKNKEFFNKLIPEPENITSKEIFSEIGYLSTYGAVPVVGGLVGGVTADVVTKDHFKKNIPDKINEGIYQYLANIFLCNVGAGAALYGMEKVGVKSKITRALGMTAGIILTGVVGGSAIANMVSNKIVCPMMKSREKTHRKPEALDLGLHADDVATVSLLSGLKWIEPALPLLYSVSGYRAGMGYRN